jgi:hypothetical protein
MMTLFGWGIAGIALLNLVVVVALGVAYAWHDGLRPRLERRRSRQRAFERLLAQSPRETEALMSRSIHPGEYREW